MDAKITPPVGYKSVTPLQKTQRVVLPKETSLPEFARSAHALPVSLSEVVPASRDYPIVFVNSDSDGGFVLMAVLGLQTGQNLFLMDDGLWDRRVYLPAYVRRYPFCMAKITRDGELQKDRVVCVEDSAVQEKGDPLFDDGGGALPAWQQIESFVVEFERDLVRAEEFCSLLTSFDLLEPVSVTAELSSGFKLQLEGIHRVSRERLNSLPEASLRSLLEGDLMESIYAHLLSLANFKRMLSRRSIFPGKKPSGRKELN